MKKVYNNGNKIKKLTEEDYLSRMNYLRGFFAILIVLGHCGRRFETEQIVLAIPHYGAFIWVCFFFMVSGWSMAYNFEKKEAYLRGFWKRKIFKLGFLAIETEFIAKILKWMILKESISFDLSILESINWYIYEMIVLYIVFWGVYRCINDHIFREVLIWFLSFTIAVGTWLLYKYNSWSGWSYAFYFSTMSFPMGVSLHRIWGKVIEKKERLLGVNMLLSVCTSTCILIPKESFVGGVVLHNALGICAMIILVICIGYIDVEKISVLGFLTKNSTYIYLFQFCVMSIVLEIFRTTGQNISGLYVLIVLIFTIGIAVVVRRINQRIENVFTYRGGVKR